MRAIVSIAALSLLCPAAVADRRSDDLVLHRELVAAIQQRDVAGVKRRIKLPLPAHGMHFDTAACAKFTGSVEVAEPELAAFVGCLADVKIAHLGGADDVWVNAVYGQGVALTFAHLRGEPVTTLFSWQMPGSREPLVEPVTFSAHIANFTREIAPQDALARKLAAPANPAVVEVDLCVDGAGKLKRLDATAVGRNSLRADRPNASDAELAVYEQRVKKVARAWKIQPFTVGGKRVGACTRLRVWHPGDRLGPLQLASTLLPRGLPSPDPAADHRTYRGPTSHFQTNRIGTSNQEIEPDAATKTAIYKAQVTTIFAGVEWCIDEQGAVATVRLVNPSGFPDFDAKVIREVSKWRYRPLLLGDEAVPACTGKAFRFTPRST